MEMTVLKSRRISSISSCQEVFCIRNFAKFTGKHLCQSLFFNKVAGLRPTNLLKKRPWHRCFSLYFAKSLRTPFLTEQLRWLLLKLIWVHNLVENKAVSTCYIRWVEINVQVKMTWWFTMQIIGGSSLVN